MDLFSIQDKWRVMVKSAIMTKRGQEKASAMKTEGWQWHGTDEKQLNKGGSERREVLFNKRRTH